MIEETNKKLEKTLDNALSMLNWFAIYFMFFSIVAMINISANITQFCYMFIFALVPTMFIFVIKLYSKIVNST